MLTAPTVRTAAPSPGATLEEVEARMRALCGLAEAGPVSAAIAHHLGAGGGRVRAALGLDAAGRLGLAPATATAIAAGAELFHNASLVHDDLQDRDRERRGAPSVWARFGDAVALCAGDLMISAAHAALASLRPRGGTAPAEIAHRAVAETARGQAAEIAPGRDEAPDLARYEAVAAAKSGPLLALPVELALAAAGHSDGARRDARRAGDRLAVAYQIADDIADAAADARRPALNAVLVIEAATGRPRAAAAAEAARIARRRLCDTRAEAIALPGGVGGAFDVLCDRVGARLGGAA